jgi:hypothetical protein
LDNEGKCSRRQAFAAILTAGGVGLAYFFGSQKELAPRLLDGEAAAGAPESDLDLGVVFLEHPLDYWTGQGRRQDLEARLAPLFAPFKLHLLLLEEENAHVQYAAIRGIEAYSLSEEFARQYRIRALTLYGDWHSWWG